MPKDPKAWWANYRAKHRAQLRKARMDYYWRTVEQKKRDRPAETEWMNRK